MLVFKKNGHGQEVSIVAPGAPRPRQFFQVSKLEELKPGGDFTIHTTAEQLGLTAKGLVAVINQFAQA